MYTSLHRLLPITYYLPMHTRVAGFGVHVPFGDIPSDVHAAVLFPVGTNSMLHLKSISVPPSVLETATMEPFPGPNDKCLLLLGMAPVWLNEAIPRSSRHPTVDYKEE